VTCAVESFTAYTCSSYYRRCIHTSLSSLQSHVLGQTATPFGKTNGTPPGIRWHLHHWSETTSFQFFSCSVAIHKLVKWKGWKWSLHFHPSDFVSERLDSNTERKKPEALCFWPSVYMSVYTRRHSIHLPEWHSCLTTMKWVHDFATTTVKCVSIDDVMQSTCTPLGSECRRLSACWTLGKNTSAFGNHTSGQRLAAAALRQPDEQTTLAQRRSDAITADMVHVVLTLARCQCVY